MATTVDQSLLHQATTTIKLVQGDTKPPLVTTLTLESANTFTGIPDLSIMDISNSTVRLKMRTTSNTSNVIDIVTGTLTAGLELANGTIITTSPWDIPGKGGRVVFYWNEDSLSVSGDLQGEIEVTYEDGSIQTAYNILKFKVREQF